VTETATAAPETGYAEVNGLKMYYEIHGGDRAGTPVLLLNGAYMTTGDFGPLLPGLAADRKVIASDPQSHGRTTDADRPITYEGLADDAAALLAHLGVDQADVVGFSMGGGVAIQLAIRHPEVVRTLVSISAGYAYDGMQPELIEMIPSITPEMFAGSPFDTTYRQVAPDPDHFPVLVEKLKTLDLTPFDWSADIPRIAAPTLIVVGDADAVRAEHAVEMFRLLGGGAMGDMAGVSKARLAMLPGTTHFIPPGIGMLDRHELLLAIVPAFLGDPSPKPPMM
jgi:pimeloyl-ACP methyl ester carboxylesterase